MSSRRPARRPAPDRGLAAVILAGGRSKRFRSETSKVLYPLAGRSLLVWVLEALRKLHRSEKLKAVCIVVPPDGEIPEALGPLDDYPFPVVFAVQRRPLGTGDAVRAGLGRLAETAELIVLYGDSPFVQADTLKRLVRERRKQNASLALLTATLEDPAAYGRIVRSSGGDVSSIIEVKDASPEERRIREINPGTYAFARDALVATLPKLRTANVQGEYYLTDAVGLLARNGGRVVGVEGEPVEALGANTRPEYEQLARIARSRIIDELYESGVTVVDPAATYVDAGVRVGRGTTILPNTYLEGATRVGSTCRIGPSTRLVDTTVGDGAEVTFAVAVGSRIGPEAEVGPFASLRPGTVLRKGAKAGTFVEMKAAEIGEDTKVPHLAYMGDVRIGARTNVGAGTITCNYNPFELAPDGSTKHRTWIGDDVYISSDTMLVAPVRMEEGSQTGAGSVVTRNVKRGTLVYGVPAVERGPAKERAKKPEGARGGKAARKGTGKGKRKGRARKEG